MNTDRVVMTSVCYKVFNTYDIMYKTKVRQEVVTMVSLYRTATSALCGEMANQQKKRKVGGKQTKEAIGSKKRNNLLTREALRVDTSSSCAQPVFLRFLFLFSSCLALLERWQDKITAFK